MSSSAIKSPVSVAPGPDWLEIVRAKVEGLSFGVVQIVVHDRKVTQIERTEKTRLDSPDSLRRRENY
ncbi:MAG: YezD family protein [Nibricoccus sp.]